MMTEVEEVSEEVREEVSEEKVKLNLLFITRDLKNSVSRGTHYLLKELGNITNLMVWHKSGNIHAILKKLPSKPDFIFIHEHGTKCFVTKCPQITGLSTLRIPYGIYLHDIHCCRGQIKRAIRRDRVRYIFTIVREKFRQGFPEFKSRMRWLPHHVDPVIFKDYGMKKDIDMLLMGEVRKRYYPLRYKILQHMRKKRNFVYHRHPGYRNFSKKEQKRLFVGEKYAREINRAKIFFTCNMTYKYPVKKYYEVLACKTLLLAPTSKELNDLGFLPGVHFVAINSKNFAQKAAYYLKNEEERTKITEQGFKMVHEKHTTEIRAKQLVEMIEQIIVKHKTSRKPSLKVKKRKRVVKPTVRIKRNRRRIRIKRIRRRPRVLRSRKVLRRKRRATRRR